MKLFSEKWQMSLYFHFLMLKLLDLYEWCSFSCVEHRRVLEISKSVGTLPAGGTFLARGIFTRLVGVVWRFAQVVYLSSDSILHGAMFMHNFLHVTEKCDWNIMNRHLLHQVLFDKIYIDIDSKLWIYPSIKVLWKRSRCTDIRLEVPPHMSNWLLVASTLAGRGQQYRMHWIVIRSCASSRWMKCFIHLYETMIHMCLAKWTCVIHVSHMFRYR